MSLHSKWQTFQKLSWSERWTIVMAMIALPVTATGVRLCGLKRWKATLEGLAPLKSPHKGDTSTRMEAARSAAWMVRIAAWNGLYRANCLQRSLTLWWLLRRKGIETDLRIGMQKENGEVRGHAWIEYNGVILNDVEDVAEQFHSFSDFESNF